MPVHPFTIIALACIAAIAVATVQELGNVDASLGVDEPLTAKAMDSCAAKELVDSCTAQEKEAKELTSVDISNKNTVAYKSAFSAATGVYFRGSGTSQNMWWTKTKNPLMNRARKDKYYKPESMYSLAKQVFGDCGPHMGGRASRWTDKGFHKNTGSQNQVCSGFADLDLKKFEYDATSGVNSVPMSGLLYSTDWEFQAFDQKKRKRTKALKKREKKEGKNTPRSNRCTATIEFVVKKKKKENVCLDGELAEGQVLQFMHNATLDLLDVTGGDQLGEGGKSRSSRPSLRECREWFAVATQASGSFGNFVKLKLLEKIEKACASETNRLGEAARRGRGRGRGQRQGRSAVDRSLYSSNRAGTDEELMT